MRGLILAAGVGTRMRPITYWRPKPLVPIADAPLIVHIIRGFVQAGVREIAVIIGHLADVMREALGDGSQWGAALTYIVQPRPAGTGDAALLARDFIRGEPFMLSWGDILVPEAHYQRVREAYEAGADGVLSVNWVEDPYEGAAVYVTDGIVTKILEKPLRGTSQTNFNNAGIFVLPPEILDITAETAPSPRGEIELPTAIGEFIAAGGKVRAVEVLGYWSDVARPRNVIEMSGIVARERGKDGLWIDATAEVGQGISFEPPVYIGPGARLSAGHSVIGPFATILSGCVLGEGTIAANCVVGEQSVIESGCQLSHVYIESGCRLAPGNSLRGSPDMPLVLPPLV